jgi:hypothetical protein
VSCLDLASEGRTPQDHFPTAETHEVREVGMSAGELFGRERAFAGGKIAQQEFLERR